MNNVLVRFVSACVLAVSWVIAWQQVLYAGELPGEGFTASVYVLLAVLLQFVVLGRETAERHLTPASFRVAMTAGFALLLALWAVPVARGAAPLSAFKVGALSSTTLFDVALLLMVAGAMLMALTGVREGER